MKKKFTHNYSFRSYLRSFILVFFISIFNQCKNDIEIKPFDESYLQPSTVKDMLSVKMAKILAVKMNDIKVRDYIKKECLKKFDEDYNFLFADSYRTLLDPNKDAQFIDSVLRFHPLMQIVLPELRTVMPETWDTQSHLPLVIIVPEKHKPGKDTLVGAYDSKGNFTKLTTVRDPKEHVVVISENVRTEFYNNRDNPSFEKIVKSKGTSNMRCVQYLRSANPTAINSTAHGSYYLKKEVSNFFNLIDATCGGGGGGGGGGGNSTPTCYRAGQPTDGKDVIGDMSYQNFDVLSSVADWTGSAKDFKMDIDYGGVNGSSVKNFSVYFWVSRHTSSSCDFFWWCWTTQFNPAVPTVSWDRTNDGEQMLYTLWALGNGQTTSNSYTYTAQGVSGTSLSYTVSRTISSRDRVLAQDYVKYCDNVIGQGTRYGVNQLAYFYIHR